jgi:hypothetical protein
MVLTIGTFPSEAALQEDLAPQTTLTTNRKHWNFTT